MFRLFLSIGFCVLTTSAHAHLGHVGELAGHGHLVGLGAIVLAGVIGTIIAKGSGKAGVENGADNTDDAQADDTEIDGEMPEAQT